jgi:hypothetical protein
VAAGICPILLLGVALARNAAEKIGPVPSLALAGVIVAVGPALYRSARSRRRISSA